MELTLLGSLFLFGLAGSLHCVGMCGPILLGFAGAFERSDGTGRPASLAGAFCAYHLGRLWTYALLGTLVGIGGAGLRHGATSLGWQRPLGLVLGLTVVATGLGLTGIVPRARIERLVGAPAEGCGLSRLQATAAFRRLIARPTLLSRFLLGATMGLLPCGLVYAMLLAVASLGSPLEAGFAMLVFGAGTLPALSAVILAGRAIPGWFRTHGTRVAAVLLILSGLWMVGRAWQVGPTAHHHPPAVPIVATFP